MFYSVAIHVVLVLWFLLFQKIVPEEVGITEISWIDPVEEIVPAELPSVVARSEPTRRVETLRETPSVHKVKKHFRRENPISTVAPQPQDPNATSDKFKERLTILQDRTADKPKKIASVSTPAPVGRSTLAGVDTEKRSRRPADLDRKGTPNSPPVELKRSPVKVQKSTVMMSTIPETNVAPTMMEDTNTDAQRELAGALLTGPVADRPLIPLYKPTYPGWAKEEAVEGPVKIYFVVLPDGRIKENIMVQKTSGFSDFDNNAVNALRTWRFEPLAGGATGEQWGTITFNYRLSDVN